MTIKIIEKAADVTKAIDSVQRRAKKLDNDIHAIGVSCLHHAEKHGDVTLMQNLIKALGRSQRKNALIGWASAFGKFQPDEKGTNVISCMTNPTDLVSATEESPWDFAPEKPFEAWDLDKALAALLKKAQTASEDSRNKVDTAKLEALSKVAGVK